MPPIVAGHEDQVAVDAVRARAKAVWPRIASDLGLAAEGARFRQLMVNSRYQHVRSVQMVQTATGQRYVLRAVFDEINAAKQLKSLDRHQQASERLRAVPGVSSPSILWRDRDSGVVLMEFAEGDTAYRALSLSDYGLAERAEVLRRIGHAVAALHRVSDVGDQRFWPKPFLKQVSTRAEAVRAGQFHVPKPKKFLGLCALLHRAGRAARGQVFRGAIEHGDLHLRNIMMSDTDVSFIDYSSQKGIYPYRDIADIWISNCPDHLAPDGCQPGFGGIASADWAAFEDGYGMRLTVDPLFRFFFTWRLFKLWSALAARPSYQHRRTADALAGALRVLDALLEDGA